MHDDHDQERNPEHDTVVVERVGNGESGESPATNIATIATSIAPHTAPSPGSTVLVNQAEAAHALSQPRRREGPELGIVCEARGYCSYVVRCNTGDQPTTQRRGHGAKPTAQLVVFAKRPGGRTAPAPPSLGRFVTLSSQVRPVPQPSRRRG